MMLVLALAADAWIALAIAALALAWLVRRGWRAVAKKRAGACGCSGEPACGKGGPTVDDFKKAAARAAERVNRGTSSVAR